MGSIATFEDLRVLPGRAYPIGSALRNGGVRFAIVSRHATQVWLALFESPDDPVPAREIAFDPVRHRTGDIWSIFVQGLTAGTLYAYRIDGPFDPARGHRYDPTRYLLDPYAKVIVGDISAGTAKCMVVDEKPDWRDDVHPRIPPEELIIYETHVRGATIHPSSGVQFPGSYLGLAEKIPYLKSLGVTAVELLPIHEFDSGLELSNPLTDEPLRNYWGYNTIGFFAPTGKYATRGGLGEQLDEFREMVRAFHQEGMEVILDVVLNHTAEGNAKGPTLSFRGIDNVIYYMLDAEREYLNFSGCGNTLNCNHPLVRDFILDCLHYWVTVMHVDGFRFDLASILGRDITGRVAENAGLIERIAEDPALRDTKLIAEAWDAGGAYQVGSFGDIRWAEWNGRYRDEVRMFWRGDEHMKGAFATRLAGSADLYQKEGRTPAHSINFITAHDGFTLRDLVSYKNKRNLGNGEGNRDGADLNYSYNFGVEGDTADPAVNRRRLRMQKSYLATLFLSLGVPMLQGGDEFGRTQRGNNNAYCQDNETSWYDWTLLEKNAELFRFAQGVIAFRKANPAFTRMSYYTGGSENPGGPPDLAWFNETGRPMDWDGPGKCIACRIDASQNEGVDIYLMFNPSLRRARFTVPQGLWALRINTATSSPDDICGLERAAHVAGPGYLTVEGKSVVLLSGPGGGGRPAGF